MRKRVFKCLQPDCGWTSYFVSDYFRHRQRCGLPQIPQYDREDKALLKEFEKSRTLPEPCTCATASVCEPHEGDGW